MSIVRFLSCSSLAVLIACSTSAHLQTADVQGRVAPTDPSGVRVFSVGEPTPAYDALGLVVAARDSGDDVTKTTAILQKEAAKLGADAVVETRMEYEYGFWRIATKLSGIAAKLK